jgi:glycogen synthase
MKALILTNEYPPNIYGGAGVHVEHLSRELARLMSVEVRCFGEQAAPAGNPVVRGHGVPAALLEHTPAALRAPLGALARSISFNAAPIDADLVHCHTWYAHFGGVLAKILYGLPLIITVHSLEPLRPWKREQLGRGYDLSAWIERVALEMADAVIAVSEETRADVLHHFAVPPERIRTIVNGVDADRYRPVEESDWLDRYGVPRGLRYVLLLGRIARQKGLEHGLRAIHHLPPDIGVVVVTGDADTEALAARIGDRVAALRAEREHVYWIRETVPRAAAVQLYSHAALYCCPSIYEPFGIVNLEAMACATPVVASAAGGIKEVVSHEATGLLVAFEASPHPSYEPRDPERFAEDLAGAMRRLLEDEDLRRGMGAAARRAVETRYAWSAVAAEVARVYEAVLGRDPAAEGDD